MAKWTNDDVLDAALEEISNNCTTIIICNAQPADRAEALAFAIADEAMAAADFTITDGDTSGRKLVIAEKPGIAIDATDTATHVALIDATRLLYVTTCASKALTLGEMVGIPSFKIELRDPA